MSKIPQLTPEEDRLVALVHFLSYGSKKEFGLTLKEVRSFLCTPVSTKGGRTPLQLIQNDEQSTFLNELKTFINELS